MATSGITAGRNIAGTPVVADDGTTAYQVQTVSADGASATTAPFSRPVTQAGIAGGNATYRVAGTGYTAYATPTDLITISGSATKTVVVRLMTIQTQSTSAALQTFYLVKRSTADTGGTSTTPTPVAFNSSRPAPSAVVSLYTAAPTVGTSAGNVQITLIASAVVTSAPGAATFTPATSVTDFSEPFILRGTGESLCLNYAGAALTPGFTATWFVEWEEY